MSDIYPDTLGGRIQQRMDALHIRQADIARELKVSRPSVSDWVNDKVQSLNSTNLIALAALLNCSQEWLNSGSGAVSPAPTALRVAEAAPIYSVSSTRDEPQEDFVRIQHLSPRPSMGSGNEVEEPVSIVQYLDVLRSWLISELGTANPDRVKILTAIGRSNHPTIPDKSLVFVDTGHRFIDAPAFYVLDVAGRFLLKKALIRADGSLELRSDNREEYPDSEIYKLSEAQDTLNISGKVLGWWSLRIG
ncbi:S24 family peptidase [Comamonas odontotermitis]|uniref:S24 family peptidase n=1 Tax=Comamonas odontotermitis TaxID=379895 RepID=UPI001CC561CE|nr:S24 family peptidase [Comamonas odontotermitis]UBB19517.1 helix-turn-helix domain-containing protein [Comamonas odontotermitis]